VIYEHLLQQMLNTWK